LLAAGDAPSLLPGVVWYTTPELTQALADLGWTVGRNVRIDLRWGGGDINRIRTLALELKQISLPQIRAGNLRALATGGRTRDDSQPEVPTLIESGFADFEASQWVGLLAPARTAPAIVERLNKTFNGALQDPEMIAKLATQGMTPGGGTPDDFAKLISAELKQWTEVARRANVVSDRN
jgi:tripartite-type tricarboxylate transporter receptor subunit TctC